jgi:hypothetical protein
MDASNPSSSSALTVATGMEQGQAHRPETPIAVGSCVEDRPTRPGRLWTNTFEQTV